MSSAIRFFGLRGFCWALIALSGLQAATLEEEGWSRFRGFNGSGIADSSDLPVEFGPQKNVLWKTPLPPGHSSPVLSKERVFLTAFEGEMLSTLCLDRTSGQILWKRSVRRTRAEQRVPRNNPAAPTPAVDERNVYVFFSELGLLSYDFEGQERWRHPLGPFENTYGMGSSPIVAGSNVILLCDQQTDSYLLAVGKEDGRVSWKAPRPRMESGHSTPILYTPPEGGTQILAAGSYDITAYDSKSGERIWWVGGLSLSPPTWLSGATPVLADGTVFVTGDFTYYERALKAGPPIEGFEAIVRQHDADGDGLISREESPTDLIKRTFKYLDLDGDGQLNAFEWRDYRAMMASKNTMAAIRLGGEGDMTKANLVWQYDRAIPQLPSPLVYGGVLYMVNHGGIVTTLRPDTGELISKTRLEGVIEDFYASPVAADGKVYMTSETGKVVVFKAGGDLTPLAVNDLQSKSYATPALADGCIYLRTVDSLYAFGLSEPAPPADPIP